MNKELSNNEFKKLLKEKLIEIKSLKVTCVGQSMKKELIQTIIKLSPTKSKIDQDFYKYFVVRRIRIDTMIRPQDLGIVATNKIKAIFEAKTDKTKYKRMLKFIQSDSKRFLFAYDYIGECDKITELFDLIADKYEKESK